VNGPCLADILRDRLRLISVLIFCAGDLRCISVRKVIDFSDNAAQEDFHWVQSIESGASVRIKTIGVLIFGCGGVGTPVAFGLEDLSGDILVAKNVVLRLDFVFNEAVASARHMLLR